MVQSGFKAKSGNNKPTKNKSSKCVAKFSKSVKLTRLGNPLQLPKSNFRDEALDARALSKAIDISNEKKVAAKLLQGGGKLTTSDIKSKGKELAKELRRNLLKKKVGRVEQKLNELKKAEEGL
jgi:hypothetical protein